MLQKYQIYKTLHTEFPNITTWHSRIPIYEMCIPDPEKDNSRIPSENMPNPPVLINAPYVLYSDHVINCRVVYILLNGKYFQPWY